LICKEYFTTRAAWTAVIGNAATAGFQTKCRKMKEERTFCPEYFQAAVRSILMSKSERFYITTPIYYVNARPHLGHAYSTIVCDAVARRKRALGIDTWFLTGTDEHGQKIERSAEKAGRSPQEFADAISGEFRGLWDQFGLTYDDYIRTTSERHKKGVQKLFAVLQERGFIYKGSYTGQYCVSDELYVDGPAGTICPDCGRVTETVSEENYFFKLSAFEKPLLDFYEANPGFMAPESTRREVISFVRSGLKDLSVSRTSFKWGIPVKGDEKHVVYVWLDALANYMTALGYGSDDPADQERFRKFWPADIHLIGKEISRFHCVYWPAFLMAAGLPLPRSVKANGWLMFDQGKMSKSRGNVVRAETVQAVLGSDALRYYLLREVPFGQDGNFSFDALVLRFNADLANGYGNLVSRVVNMTHKFFAGAVPEAGELTPAETDLRAVAEKTLAEFGPAFDQFNFSEALKSLWLLVAATDGYLTANAPWKKPAERSDADHTQLQARVLATAAEAIRIITALAYPVLPDATAKVWLQLGQGEIADAAKNAFLTNLAWGGLKVGTKFAEPSPLFPRAEKDAVERMQNLEAENNKTVIEAAGGGTCGAADRGVAAPANATDAPAEANASTPAEQAPENPLALPAPYPDREATITIDDVVKLDLRVAQVLVAERVPKADKLLRLEVDLGYEKRQILAGMAQYYTPEQMVGRKIIIVANLAPRKLRGFESNGMLLAASLEDSNPVLAGFLEDVPLGARLK
jgi:methionyl-tRNA synthetase